MTSHIHFLVTPGSEDAISNTMKVIGSRYAYYFNKQLNRTGTLWEGRHKASLSQMSDFVRSCRFDMVSNLDRCLEAGQESTKSCTKNNPSVTFVTLNPF